ncbi:hypothetical protein OUZ56_014091 [Daphnia magna]|uniref:Uncharacterized protein n=1 Tax=Daphnia magna TaxID=35525 RepID=A0ABQ9Z7V1_9CRUS|nr:hypothetical protein OUZ56_014091 [Daphnia magna]
MAGTRRWSCRPVMLCWLWMVAAVHLISAMEQLNAESQKRIEMSAVGAKQKAMPVLKSPKRRSRKNHELIACSCKRKRGALAQHRDVTHDAHFVSGPFSVNPQPIGKEEKLWPSYSQLPPALTQKRFRDRLRGVVFLLRNRGGSAPGGRRKLKVQDLFSNSVIFPDCMELLKEEELLLLNWRVWEWGLGDLFECFFGRKRFVRREAVTLSVNSRFDGKNADGAYMFWLVGRDKGRALKAGGKGVDCFSESSY